MLTRTAAPVAASGLEIDFAASSIFLKASGVEISGLGAPFLTATPTATEARGVALVSTTLPEARTSGNGGWTHAAPGAPPRHTFRFVPPPKTHIPPEP